MKVIVRVHRDVEMGTTCPERDCQPGSRSKSGQWYKPKDLGRVGWGLGDRGGLPGRCWSGEQCPGQDLQQWAGVLPGPPLVSRGSVKSQRISGSVAGSRPRQGPGKKLTPCPEAFSPVLTLPQRLSSWGGGEGVSFGDKRWWCPSLGQCDCFLTCGSKPETTAETVPT